LTVVPIRSAQRHIVENRRAGSSSIVPPGQVGTALAAPALAIEPTVAGEARWLDARTLAFFPREKLRASTAYTFTLAPALQTAPDVALASWPASSPAALARRTASTSRTATSRTRFAPATRGMTGR
jgi:hypothetical protein